MSEILTESFCERCGTRYTFESANSKVRLKGVKVLSRGLKNFVLSDDTSLDEAMAAARSEADREVTAHQLDAFHKTFNFCMSCRQYTCPNCWNDIEARCLSCAPAGALELAPALFDQPATNGANRHVHADSLGLTETPNDPAMDALGRFSPGQNLDEELAAFERERTDATASSEDGPAPAADELALVAEALPLVAQAQPEAEPPSAVVEPQAEREPEPAASVVADGQALPLEADLIEQPTWRVTAPDEPAAQTAGTPGDAPPAQVDSPVLPPAEPHWPMKPEWPTRQASIGLPFLGRPAQPQGGVDALWAASNQQLAATPQDPARSTSGIQPCISCGLSLSASARFCRRCGALQNR